MTSLSPVSELGIRTRHIRNQILKQADNMKDRQMNSVYSQKRRLYGRSMPQRFQNPNQEFVNRVDILLDQATGTDSRQSRSFRRKDLYEISETADRLVKGIKNMISSVPTSTKPPKTTSFVKSSRSTCRPGLLARKLELEKKKVAYIGPGFTPKSREASRSRTSVNTPSKKNLRSYSNSPNTQLSPSNSLRSARSNRSSSTRSNRSNASHRSNLSRKYGPRRNVTKYRKHINLSLPEVSTSRSIQYRSRTMTIQDPVLKQSNIRKSHVDQFYEEKKRSQRVSKFQSPSRRINSLAIPIRKTFR